MKRHLQNIARQDFRDLVVYGWLTVISAGVAVALAAVFVNISQRHHAQQQTNAMTCAEVNYVVDYFRVFNNTTPKQTQAQVIAINKALASATTLSNADRQILLAVFDAIGRAELAAPSLATLHPFTLADLPCKIRIPVSGGTGFTGATSSTRP